jgi:hypothetical protein
LHNLSRSLVYQQHEPQTSFLAEEFPSHTSITSNLKMILKYNLFATAVFITQTNSFTPSIATRTTTNLCSLNSGWDNNDFLSALSGNPDELQKVNDDYEALSGANQKKNEWLAKSMSPQQQGGPSPDFLQKMGVQQQQQGGAPQMPPQQQFQQPPPQQFAQQPPPVQQQQFSQQPPPQQQFYDQYGNPITAMPMFYDANGNPITFPQQVQPQPVQPVVQQVQGAALPPQFIPVAEPPLPPKTKGNTADNKPVGYNADAYTISNTADVYFAQLKQDSKVRKLARLAGDIETANKVFNDETVRKIGDSWVDNPYTREQNVKEARAQIEGSVRMQVLGGTENKGVSQISYKEKLEEMKAKRRGGGGGSSTKPAVESVASPVPPAPVAPTLQTNVVQSNPIMPPPQVKTVDVPKAGTPFPTMPGPTSPANTGPTQMNPPPVATAATPMDSEEETRRKVRTLQGLLLKQRGGPGFGAGRLKAPEAQRLESTLNEVKDILRSEVGGNAGMESVAGSPSPAVQTNPLPKAPPKVVQPSPQALVAPQTPPPPPATPAASDPIAGTVACVEAALKMYKEANSLSEKEALLVPLREAFMAAVGASNKAIAERELGAHKAAVGVTSSSPPVQPSAPVPPVAKQSAPVMGFPTSYNVAKPEIEKKEVAYTAVGNDNTKTLEDAYNALKEASGDGKFGLKNISGNEVSVCESVLRIF